MASGIDFKGQVQPFVSALGLLESIQHELNLVTKITSIKTSFSITGAQVEVQKNIELILFRIFQEALNNVVKHAKAKQLVVTIKYELAMLRIQVWDDG